ncbi:MAG: hypothetical protein WD669_00830 [Pirellulales bacterium]
MQQVIVESVVEQALANASGNVVFCDSQGRAIGIFSPLHDRPLVSGLQLEPPLSIAEAEELRKKQRTGKPLEEILGRLGH